MSRIRRHITIRFGSGRHAFSLIDYEIWDINERIALLATGLVLRFDVSCDTDVNGGVE